MIARFSRVAAAAFALLLPVLAMAGAYAPPTAGNGLGVTGTQINFSACTGNGGSPVTTAYTVQATDAGCILLVNATTTITVSSAATYGNGGGFIVFNASSAANNFVVTVSVPSGTGPEGVSSFTIAAGAGYEAQIDQGGNWIWLPYGTGGGGGSGCATSGCTYTGAISTTTGSLTYASTITPSFAASNVFQVTLTGPATLACPTNLKPWTTYDLYLTQDGTGSRTASFGSCWLWPTVSGTIQTPTLSTAANATDRIRCGTWNTSTLYCNAIDKQFATSVVSFTGVGDKESTYNHFFGVVAGSSALATSGVKAVDISNNSTTCVGVTVLASGQLDTSVGLYCNGATQTVTTWCSTNCVSGGTARATKLYDQLNPTTITAVSASYATSPDFILSGFSSKPAIGCVASRSTLLLASITAIPPPFSMGVTFERNAGFTSFSGYASDGASSSGGTMVLGGAGSASQAQGQIFGDTAVAGAATDGTGTSDFSHGHSMLYVVPNGATNQALYIDGTAQTPVALSGAPGSTNPQFAICGFSSEYAGAFMTRAWTDPTLVNSTVGGSVTNLSTVPLP